MTAYETLREMLDSVQKAQADCINEDGIVRNDKKYKYSALVEKARELKENKTWWEKNMLKIDK